MMSNIVIGDKSPYHSRPTFYRPCGARDSKMYVTQHSANGFVLDYHHTPRGLWKSGIDAALCSRQLLKGGDLTRVYEDPTLSKRTASAGPLGKLGAGSSTALSACGGSLRSG